MTSVLINKNLILKRSCISLLGFCSVFCYLQMVYFSAAGQEQKQENYNFVYASHLTKKECENSGAVWILSTGDQPHPLANRCTIPDSLANAIEQEVIEGNLEAIQERIDNGLPASFPFSHYYGLFVIGLAFQKQQCEIAEAFFKAQSEQPILLHSHSEPVTQESIDSCYSYRKTLEQD